MAGRGPRPKDPDQRARTNSDPLGVTKLALKSAPQPKLPPCPKWLGGRWPVATQRWWETWGEAAQAELFTATDWDYLLDTALIHAQVWKGDGKLAGELRLRVAKFGATAEDRARLRYVADVDDPEVEAQRPGRADTGARARYGHLRALPGAAAAGDG